MKRNVLKVSAAVLTGAMLCGALSGCTVFKHSAKANGDDDQYVLVSPDVCNMVGDETEDMVTFLAELNPDMKNQIEADDESVRIYYTDDQLEQWDTVLRDKIEEADPEAGLAVNDDFTELDYCYDVNYLSSLYVAAGANAITEVSMYPLVYCALYQELHGIRAWSFELVLTNSKTGKMVTTTTFEYGEDVASGEISPTDQEWSDSFVLTADEIDALKADASSEMKFLKVSSALLAGEEAIAVERDILGTNYDYIYADENGDVWLGVNEDQQAENPTACEDYITQIVDQFPDEGTDYKIEISGDYTEVSFYFDADLDEQTQVNYIAYTAAACQTLLLLQDQDTPVTLHIYNSATGDKVSDGDTQTGIEWNME